MLAAYIAMLCRSFEVARARMLHDTNISTKAKMLLLNSRFEPEMIRQVIYKGGAFVFCA